MRLGWVVLVVALLASGCASVRSTRDQGSVQAYSPLRGSNLALYLPNRLLDLGDTVSASAGLGLGLHVRVRLGGLAQVALPFQSVSGEVGWNATWVEPDKDNGDITLAERYAPLALGGRGGAGWGLPFVEIGGGREIGASPDEVQVGVFVLVVGANVGVRPVEILDFLGGFLFLDVCSDDLYRPRPDGGAESGEGERSPPGG